MRGQGHQIFVDELARFADRLVDPRVTAIAGRTAGPLRVAVRGRRGSAAAQSPAPWAGRERVGDRGRPPGDLVGVRSRRRRGGLRGRGGGQARGRPCPRGRRAPGGGGAEQSGPVGPARRRADRGGAGAVRRPVGAGRGAHGADDRPARGRARRAGRRRRQPSVGGAAHARRPSWGRYVLRRLVCRVPGGGRPGAHRRASAPPGHPRPVRHRVGRRRDPPGQDAGAGAHPAAPDERCRRRPGQGRRARRRGALPAGARSRRGIGGVGRRRGRARRADRRVPDPRRHGGRPDGGRGGSGRGDWAGPGRPRAGRGGPRPVRAPAARRAVAALQPRLGERTAPRLRLDIARGSLRLWSRACASLPEESW